MLSLSTYVSWIIYISKCAKIQTKPNQIRPSSFDNWITISLLWASSIILTQCSVQYELIHALYCHTWVTTRQFCCFDVALTASPCLGSAWDGCPCPVQHLNSLCMQPPLTGVWQRLTAIFFQVIFMQASVFQGLKQQQTVTKSWYAMNLYSATAEQQEPFRKI